VPPPRRTPRRPLLDAQAVPDRRGRRERAPPPGRSPTEQRDVHHSGDPEQPDEDDARRDDPAADADRGDSGRVERGRDPEAGHEHPGDDGREAAERREPAVERDGRRPGDERDGGRPEQQVVQDPDRVEDERREREQRGDADVVQAGHSLPERRVERGESVAEGGAVAVAAGSCAVAVAPHRRPEQVDPRAVACRGRSLDPPVEHQGAGAEPAEDVEDGVLLGREPEAGGGRARPEVAVAPGVRGADEQAERDEHERRDEDVVAVEPRVVQQHGVRREHQRQSDHLAVPEVLAEQPRRRRQEGADDGHDQPEREVARADQGEDGGVDVDEEGTVDDRAVLPDAGLLEAERPVGDPALVPLEHAVAEEGDAEGEPDDGEREHGEQRPVAGDPRQAEPEGPSETTRVLGGVFGRVRGGVDAVRRRSVRCHLPAVGGARHETLVIAGGPPGRER